MGFWLFNWLTNGYVFRALSEILLQVDKSRPLDDINAPWTCHSWPGGSRCMRIMSWSQSEEKIKQHSIMDSVSRAVSRFQQCSALALKDDEIQPVKWKNTFYSLCSCLPWLLSHKEKADVSEGCSTFHSLYLSFQICHTGDNGTRV